MIPPSPKSQFLSEGVLVKAHLDTVDSKSFVEASKAAMLQMLAEQPDVTDPTTCLASYHRLIGARSYLRMLQTIADKNVSPEKKPVFGNLNHDT